MSSLVEKVINIAAGEVGYHEGRSGGHWNNNQKYSDETPSLEWSDWQAWCATFVSWVAMKAGAAALFPRTASCLTGVAWFRKAGRFSYYPAVGAQVFFGPRGGSHTGIVYKYDADTIWTIEGNTNDDGSYEGDGVYRKSHHRRDDYVYGYGYPDYPGGIVSADPDWSGDEAGGVKPDGGASAPVHSGGSAHPARYTKTIHGLTYGYGAHGAHVTRVGRALVAKGFGDAYEVGPGPEWTDADTRNYAAFQRSLGYSGKDADGVPGEASLDALFDGKPPRKRRRYEPFPGAAFFHDAPRSAVVEAMGRRLVAEGCSHYRVGPGPQWTEADRRSYAAWQRKCGYSGSDADGWPGATSWRKLRVPEV